MKTCTCCENIDRIYVEYPEKEIFLCKYCFNDNDYPNKDKISPTEDNICIYSPFVEADWGETPKTKLCIGMELELATSNSKKILQILNESQLKNKVLVFSDESIKTSDRFSYDCEIVTSPLTYDEHKNIKYKNILQEIKKISRSSERYNCGIHLHVNKNFFGSERKINNLRKKMIDFFDENSTKLKKFSGRKDFYYCRFPNDFDFTLGSSKYRCINFNHTETIEFRIFVGTLDHKKIQKSIDFVNCFCLFFKQNSKKQKLDWTSFIEFCDTNNREMARYLARL